MAEINNPVNVNYSAGNYKSFNVHPAYKVYKKDYTNLTKTSNESERFVEGPDLLYMDSTNGRIDLDIAFTGMVTDGRPEPNTTVLLRATRTFTLNCVAKRELVLSSTGSVWQDFYYVGKVNVGGTIYGDEDIDPEYGNAPFFLKGIASGFFVANQPHPTVVVEFGVSNANATVEEVNNLSVWFVPKDETKANAVANRFVYEISNISEATEISDIIIQSKNGEDNLFLTNSSTIGLFDKTNTAYAYVSGMSTSNLDRIGVLNNALIYRPVTITPSFHQAAEHGHINLNFDGLYKVGIDSSDELLTTEPGVYPVKISLLGQNLNLSPDIGIDLINIEDISHL